LKNNDLKQQKNYQQSQYQSIKEETEMPQSAAIQEKLKRFEQDTNNQSNIAENNKKQSNSNNINNVKLPTAQESDLKQQHYSKGTVIEDNKYNSNTVGRRIKSPYETNKENSPINQTKPGQYNSQQTHTFQAIQPSQSKRPVSINTTNNDSASSKTSTANTTTNPFQQSTMQPTQQNYYFNKTAQPQSTSNAQLSLNSANNNSNPAKLSDSNSNANASPNRAGSFVAPQSYKYSQMPAPSFSSSTSSAVSPLNMMKQPVFFEKSPPPPSNNQINANLAIATANAAAAVNKAQQNSNMSNSSSNSNNNSNNSNTNTIPKSPSQAFTNNIYETVQTR